MIRRTSTMTELSKKEQVFALFNEGKKPDDPEVIAIGLARRTVQNYQTLWQKQQAKEKGGADVCAPCKEAAGGAPVAATQAPAQPVPAPQGTVSVESIPDGSLFESKSLLYKKLRQVYSGQVIATRVIGVAYASTFRERGTAEFKPGVMVVPK